MKEELTEKQKRITEIMGKINNVVKPILENEFVLYKKDFGFTSEDGWLMLAGIDIDLLVITTATKVTAGIIK